MDISDRLRNMLHQIFPDAKDASSGREVTINCPLCAQQGDPDHGRHMYISLGLDNKPPMYNCFRRTGHNGLLTKSALERLSSYSQYIDTGLFDELEKRNKALSNYGRTQSIREQKIALNIPKINSQNKCAKKLDYISNRLGIEFSYQMAQENKIILSLYDFLAYNRINTLTMNKYCVDELNNNFVGFLTNTNTSIICRNLYNMKEGNYIQTSRYIKYNVIPNPPLSYYIIPTQCDLYKPIELHIAEGTFDILSVFYNLHHGDRKNKIYAAIGSKAYLNLIKYFLIDIGIVDFRLYVYIDGNIENEIIWQFRKVLHPLNIHGVICTNVYHGEKDFGVPLDRIALYTTVL